MVCIQLQETKDFLEGVRARVVERRAPHWTHSSVDDVTQEEIDRFFRPLGGTCLSNNHLLFPDILMDS